MGLSDVSAYYSGCQWDVIYFLVHMGSRVTDILHLAMPRVQHDSLARTWYSIVY